MKALLSIIIVLLAGILYLEIDARIDRARERQKKISDSPPSTKAAPKPPILTQSNLYQSGGNPVYLHFEGKIYNPNSFGVTNVRVHWQVYPKPTAKEAEVFERFKSEESCGFEFAFIPPLTTYDFKTEKIKSRGLENVDTLGMNGVPMTDLKPEITFVATP